MLLPPSFLFTPCAWHAKWATVKYKIPHKNSRKKGQKMIFLDLCTKLLLLYEIGVFIAIVFFGFNKKIPKIKIVEIQQTKQ